MANSSSYQELKIFFLQKSNNYLAEHGKFFNLSRIKIFYLRKYNN